MALWNSTCKLNRRQSWQKLAHKITFSTKQKCFQIVIIIHWWLKADSALLFVECHFSWLNFVRTWLDSGRHECGWPGSKTSFSISWFNPSTELRIGLCVAHDLGDRGGIDTGLAAINKHICKKSSINCRKYCTSSANTALTVYGTQCLRTDWMFAGSLLSPLQSLS